MGKWAGVMDGLPELEEALDELCMRCKQISEANCSKTACEICPTAKVKQSIVQQKW